MTFISSLKQSNSGRRHKTAALLRLVVVSIGGECAERGGKVSVRVCEESASNGFKLFLRQVAGELTAKHPIVFMIRHSFSPL